MRVCTAKQMARIDEATIAQGVPGRELMERAGEAIFARLLGFLDDLDTHDEAPEVLVLCGPGNNGGDGLVVARLLAAVEIPVRVLLLGDPAKLTPDAAANLERLEEGVVFEAPAENERIGCLAAALEDADVVVDAILGTGIRLPLRPGLADLIRLLNDSGLPCVALDIPSGVAGDDGAVDPVAVAAELTITVGLPKLGLLQAPGRDFTGDLEVVDIGFPPDICDEHALPLQWLSRNEYLGLLPPRRSSSHKYECGSVLGIAGSRPFAGAAQLTARGMLRSGAGLVTLGVPHGLEVALNAALPEVIVHALAGNDAAGLAPVPQPVLQELLDRKQAVAIGPGLEADRRIDEWIVDFLAELDIPVVVDAGALGAFARTGRHPACNPDEAVFTPHAGELARLVGLTATEVTARALELVPELAAAWGVVLVLKGSPTLIAAPDGRCFINASGNDALARGGSGDLLTGLIAGLLAQGASALDAALLGVHVHGLAGEAAAQGRSTRAVRVVEIAAAIGPVLEGMEKDASSCAALREKLWPVSGPGGAG